MSEVWKLWIDKLVANSGDVKKAAIIDRVRGTPLACSENFLLTEAEGLAVLKVLKAMTGPVTLAGVDYLCVRGDVDRVHAKGLDSDAIICNTNSLVLISVHDKNNRAQALSAFKKVKEDLLDAGY